MSDDMMIQTCPDGHHCFHGSICAQNPYDETAYYCDCDEVVFDARYEGLYCEHQADVYCISQGVHQHSFCTNGGNCLEYVGPDEAHVGCECPDEYEGSHCQFVKGTKPEGWPFTNQLPTKNGNGMKDVGSSSGIIIATIVLVLVFGIIVAAMVFRRCTTQEEYKENATGRDLNLDADGGELKRAIAQPVNHEEPLRSKITAIENGKGHKDDESLVSIT